MNKVQPIFLLALLLVIQLLAFSQSELLPFSQEDKWGYKNEKAEVIISPKFDRAAPFEGSVARVEIDSKMGLIDQTGNVVLPIQYFPFDEFRNGLTAVREYNTVGVVNKKGEWILPSKFQYAYSNDGEEYIYTKNSVNEVSVYTLNGQLVLETGYTRLNNLKNRSFVAEKNGKFGVISLKNKEIIPFEYEELKPSENGLLLATKEVTLQIEIKKIPFDEQLFATDYSEPEQSVDLKKKLLYLHLNEQQIAEMKSYGLNQLREKSIELKGLLTYEGKEIVPIQNTEFRKVESDSIWMVEYFGKTGIYSLKGEELAPPIYAELNSFYNGYAIAKLDNKYGVISAQGEITVPFEFEMLQRPSEQKLGVYKNDNWGFIEIATQKPITEFIYENLLPFSENRAGVRKDKKWGFIDCDGAEIIDLKYAEVKSFEKEKAWVKNGEGLWGIIDTNGNEVLSPILNSPYLNFENGFAVAQSGRNFGLLNDNYEIVLPFNCSKIGRFYEGLAVVAVKNPETGRDTYGYVNETGEVVIPLKYSFAQRFSNGKARVQDINRKTFYIDKNGNRLK